jgi:hypothetical protein
MMHSVDELVAIVHQYYPRGVAASEPQHNRSEEHRRLREARVQAGTGEPYERWYAMLCRIRAQLPSTDFMNYSTHLPTGDYDGGYSARLFLPTVPPNKGTHSLGFLVSFLAPYYVISRSRSFIIPGTAREPFKDMPEDLPADWSTPDEMSFELDPEEEPYARAIATEIEATFPGHEPMRPEVGKQLVPEIGLGSTNFGRATIYDCLFTEQW